MMNTLRKSLLLVFSVFAISLNAVILHPLTGEFTATNEQLIFKITNPSSEMVAVEITTTEIIETTANEEITKESDSMIVYPEQVVLQPKESKALRVAFTDEVGNKERLFRLNVDELDLNIGDNKKSENASVKVRFNYKGMLIVHNNNKREPKLAITNFKENKENFTFTISNSGNASTYIKFEGSDCLTALLENGKKLKLTADHFKNSNYLVMKRILPNKSLTYVIKKDDSLKKIIGIEVGK